MSKTFVIKISKFQTNSRIKTLGFVWNFKIFRDRGVGGSGGGGGGGQVPPNIFKIIMN